MREIIFIQIQEMLELFKKTKVIFAIFSRRTEVREMTVRKRLGVERMPERMKGALRIMETVIAWMNRYII